MGFVQRVDQRRAGRRRRAIKYIDKQTNRIKDSSGKPILRGPNKPDKWQNLRMAHNKRGHVHYTST